MKKLTSFILFVIFAISSLNFAGCDSEKNKIKVWSTYNTLKVMREFGEYPDLGAEIDVLMALGETEGAQLLLTPDKRVKKVDMIVSDLESTEGDVFSAENVEVYFQKYIDVTIKTQGQTNIKYPVGETPDLLLPLETAVRFGETSVGSGQNQGLTIEFSTTSETKPGIYTGTFILKADSETFEIPVKLEVADVDITVSHGKTSIRAISMQNMNGEYNNSPEMYRKYYETAMDDYKFNFDYLPGSRDPEQMAENAIYYWDNPHFTSFGIPAMAYSSNDPQTNNMLMKGDFYSYLYALGKNSEPNRILFDKAYVYPLYLDEVKPESYSAVGKNMDAFYEIEEKVFADLENEGYFNKFDSEYKEGFRKSIKSIPIVITANRAQLESLGNTVNTYCAQIDQFNLSYMRDAYTEAKAANAEHGGEIWFYTCMEPIYPYPSHHIDDNLLGARVMRWMQKDYDLDGYLHWAFNSYHIWTGSETINCDPYAEASRFPGTVGDGFMMYPGKKYNIDTFLPSLRLTTFRDGQEDYDLLCILDEIVSEKEKFFDLEPGTVNTREFLGELYDSLYTGTIYNEDDSLLYAARRQLFDALKEHRSETKYLLQSDIVGKFANSEIYLADGYDLKVNGELLAPSKPSGAGNCYIIRQSLEEEARLNIEILLDGQIIETHNVLVAPQTKFVDLNEKPISVSKESSFEINGGIASVTLRPQGNTETELLTFIPYLRFDRNIFGETLEKIDNVSFDVTNKTDFSLEFKVRLRSGYSVFNLGSYSVEPGETKTIAFKNMYSYIASFAELSKASIEICGENTDENGKLMPSQIIELSNVSCSLYKGGV